MRRPKCGSRSEGSGCNTREPLFYKGDESFEIKKSNIRGEFSEGMICAEDELGLGNSHEGIMVLDNDAKPGTPA